MPKVKWGIDVDEPEELDTFDVYDGPEPRPGVYHGVLKRLTLKENRNGDDMMNGLFVVQESNNDSDKQKFNGWGVWFNQNITDQGKPYLLLFLKSLGLTWRDFVSSTVTESAERPTNIIKIGRVKFNDGNEPKLRVQVKMGKASGDGQYPARLEIGQFLPPKDADAEWDSADDASDSDEEDPFA